jgi:2-phosphosulfolactate phosphatase
MIFNQSEFDIRCEWGRPGVEQLAAISDVVIIVDVLSFCSTVSLAVSRGAIIYPYPDRDHSLVDFASRMQVQVAGHRRDGGYSLSPASMLNIPRGTRLILPSPNGGRLSMLVQGKPVFAGCLRNAAAVATAASRLGKRIAVIPAGELWQSDGALRPSLEDWLGAGAIISGLPGRLSPESRAALMAYSGLQKEMLDVLLGCSSGKELKEPGFVEDIRLSALINADGVAPRFVDGAYQAAAQIHRK